MNYKRDESNKNKTRFKKRTFITHKDERKISNNHKKVTQ